LPGAYQLMIVAGAFHSRQLGNINLVAQASGEIWLDSASPSKRLSQNSM